MERLKGVLLLVPPVSLMLLTAPTRIILGCLLIAKLNDEYFSVIAAHESSSTQLSLLPAAGVSQGSPLSPERVLSAALGCGLFIAAHWGPSALLAAFVFAAMVR